MVVNNIVFPIKSIVMGDKKISIEEIDLKYYLVSETGDKIAEIYSETEAEYLLRFLHGICKSVYSDIPSIEKLVEL